MTNRADAFTKAVSSTNFADAFKSKCAICENEGHGDFIRRELRVTIKCSHSDVYRKQSYIKYDHICLTCFNGIDWHK